MWPSTARERLFPWVLISHCSPFFSHFLYHFFPFFLLLLLLPSSFFSRDNEQIARAPFHPSPLFMLLIVPRSPASRRPTTTTTTTTTTWTLDRNAVLSPWRLTGRLLTIKRRRTKNLRHRRRGSIKKRSGQNR